MPEPRLALIGSGPIAGSHVDAARHAGFRVTDVAGRPESSRAPRFAARHSIPNAWNDPLELAATGDWDALLIAVDTTATLGLLLAAADRGKPVLVEKPVALESADLAPFRSGWGHVIVGYNRRHYEPVRQAKRFAVEHGRCLVQMELPDAVPPAYRPNPEREYGIRINSVHGLDLLRYLLGDLSVESVSSLGEPDAYLGRFVTLRSVRGDLCTVTANWNAPANFGVTLDAGAERFQLRPFELGSTFHGMEVVEPTPEVPIRQYRPIRTGTVWPDEFSVEFKPGFVRQAMALRRLVDGEDAGPEAASMNDAYEALALAEVVLRGRACM